MCGVNPDPDDGTQVAHSSAKQCKDMSLPLIILPTEKFDGKHYGAMMGKSNYTIERR